VVDPQKQPLALLDRTQLHAALVTQTLNLADTLLHQAAKDIEAILFERVRDQLREQLPELIDRALREQGGSPPGGVRG